MPKELEALLAAARRAEVAPGHEEAQRRSFAYGNTHFENRRITRKTVDEAAELLRSDEKNGHPEGQ